MQQASTRISLETESSTFSKTFTMRRVTVTNAPIVTVNFTPAIINCQAEGLKFLKSHPAFNNDGQYYTPAFMLEQDKMRVANNLPIFKQMHDSRLAETIEEKDQLLVPKPSKTSSYCSVCKILYDDYSNHLQEPTHVQTMKKNHFWKDINKLCKIFNTKSTRKAKIIKQKPIKKTAVKTTKFNMEGLNLDSKRLTQTLPEQPFMLQENEFF